VRISRKKWDFAQMFDGNSATKKSWRLGVDPLCRGHQRASFEILRDPCCPMGTELGANVWFKFLGGTSPSLARGGGGGPKVKVKKIFVLKIDLLM
jgi:hypothetical protein